MLNRAASFGESLLLKGLESSKETRFVVFDNAPAAEVFFFVLVAFIVNSIYGLGYSEEKYYSSNKNYPKRSEEKVHFQKQWAFLIAFALASAVGVTFLFLY